METTFQNIPVISKIKPSSQATAAEASSCCVPKADATSCCTPSKAAEENNGACCAQPADGATCCDK